MNNETQWWCIYYMDHFSVILFLFPILLFLLLCRVLRTTTTAVPGTVQVPGETNDRVYVVQVLEYLYQVFSRVTPQRDDEEYFLLRCPLLLPIVTVTSSYHLSLIHSTRKL
jgi:hypothetical protein